MKTIWKFELDPVNSELDMPEGAQPFTVGWQGQNLSPVLWAMVDSDEPMVRHRFAVVGTGHPFPDTINLDEHVFLGTAICGPLVWHVWDLGERNP